MDFDFSEEQRELKGAARRFLTARCPLSLVRATLAEDPERRASRALYKEIAELGWCGAAIPEASGGFGLGYVELCAIAEELGRGLAPGPFASSLYFFAAGGMAGGAGGERARGVAAAIGSRRDRRLPRHRGGQRRPPASPHRVPGEGRAAEWDKNTGHR